MHIKAAIKGKTEKYLLPTGSVWIVKIVTYRYVSRLNKMCVFLVPTVVIESGQAN